MALARATATPGVPIPTATSVRLSPLKSPNAGHPAMPATMVSAAAEVRLSVVAPERSNRPPMTMARSWSPSQSMSTAVNVPSNGSEKPGTSVSVPVPSFVSSRRLIECTGSCFRWP